MSEQQKERIALIGPSLSTLTVEQIDEFLALCKQGASSADFVAADHDGLIDRFGPSIHPRVYVAYRKAGKKVGFPHNEFLEIFVWEGGGESGEYDYWGLELYAGSFHDHWGGTICALDVVHWFLCHGWQWSVPVTERRGA